MYMIRGSWGMLHLFCGSHGALKELVMEPTSKEICYCCPEFVDGKPCDTRLSLKEYEEILAYLSDQIVKAEVDGEVINLTHTTWRTKSGVACRVLLHQEERIHVMVDCAKRKRR